MDKMREEFERWAKDNFAADSVGAWLAWKELYPKAERLRELVPSSYSEGFHAGEYEQTQVFLCRSPKDKSERWNNSTAKARLEGKDE